jgi:signal transduction histidine kinase
VRQRKDGSLVDISLTVSPIKDRHGKIVGISKTARDITDKKRAEETLRRQHRELAELDVKKNEFLAMLGHELRNPLAAIQNAAELLGEESEPSTQLWATGIVRRQIALLARLVEDLVDVSRITRGRIELRRDNVDICPILRRALETARPLIEERRHTIEFSHPPDTLLVSADSARLEQLLVNLLANSAKYTDPGGLIQLSATPVRDNIVVAVKDNGMGIPPDLLSDIFELFVQDKRGLDRSRGGLGIGLALSKRLAEMHGGTLSAASDGPGKGSVFTLVIPALPSHERLHASNHPPAAANNGNGTARRILLVDDNKDSAQSVSRLLERRGHQVRVVHDGVTALEIARDFAPDTFLLDLGLPGMDGFELSRKLHVTGFANALFIAISGYAQPQDIDRSRIAGFQHHLAKPVDIERIKEVLATFSGRL